MTLGIRRLAAETFDFPPRFLLMHCLRKKTFLLKLCCVHHRVGTLVSQEQMSKGIMSILVISSCLNVSVWICAHALCTKSFDSKFQVPSSIWQSGALHPLLVADLSARGRFKITTYRGHKPNRTEQTNRRSCPMYLIVTTPNRTRNNATNKLQSSSQQDHSSFAQINKHGIDSCAPYSSCSSKNNSVLKIHRKILSFITPSKNHSTLMHARARRDLRCPSQMRENECAPIRWPVQL